MLDRAGRIFGAVWTPRTAVPDDHVTTAVLPRRNYAFEIEVFDRVVFHVHREMLRARVQRRALRHRPTHEDAVHFQAKVVVQAPGPMALHDESRRTSTRRIGDSTAWLRRLGEVALLRVLGEPTFRSHGALLPADVGTTPL